MKKRLLTITILLVTSLGFVATSAFAKNNIIQGWGSNNNKASINGLSVNPNERPGWGHGDKNHEHSGPPGQSVNINN